ncbi:MAG: four helix bundle protein [Nitrospirota bacterium]|nr:four helix bundle protein [Nitrospirota bacterium]MDE3035916.1 four helix bundle protein [Nitrospirota bacterium]MDE3224711.1 four helix bundle protein [Nitrospirota bacterium]MDE3243764.1 four helix bundle protein [Nitrospirota bacterium]
MRKNTPVTHKDLDVWRKAMDLVEVVYSETGRFPKEELYGLVLQTRRSAVSIPSNIAEGAARNSRKEFIQFLYIALGSLAELETQLMLAARMEFLSDNGVFNRIEQTRKLLLGLLRSLKQASVPHSSPITHH